MRALFAFLVVGLTALVAGAIGFQLGVVSNIGAAGGTVWVGGWFPGFGFLFFPFFFLLFVGLLFLAFGGGRRRWEHGWGGPVGPGRWGGDPLDPSDPRRHWIEEAHRRLHESEAATPRSGGPGAPGSPTPGSTDAASGRSDRTTGD